MRLALKVGIALGAALILNACSPDAPPSPTGPVTSLRRLTPDQYANIVRDVFGSGIEVVVGFDPLVRTDGLLALGTATVGMTPLGFEQFEKAGRAVAAQVTAEKNRTALIPCTPSSTQSFDETCATVFLNRTGRLLFRRPLTAEELAARVAMARAAAESNRDFYAGISSALSSLLMAPAFVYVTETVNPDPALSAKLDDYAIASRLSFLLWNTTPDDSLLADAERGVLRRERGLARQVDRMLESPRLQRGVRAFFADMLALDRFAVLEKDPTIYPVFSLAVAQDGREQVLRTITDTLILHHADYRDLFTTRNTYLSDNLARLYQVPAPNPGAWGVYEFPPEDPRVGIQSEFAVTALFSHPGRSSPTLRGKAIREQLLCQKIPDPPSDVDFTLFSKSASDVKSARERLELHSTEAACAGCHRLMDPIGLALENFDGVGQFRTSDGGAAIDTSGILDGANYADAAGLARALHDSPAAPACLVMKLYAYATGRKSDAADRIHVLRLQEQFARSGYRLRALLREIALAPAFYDARRPQDTQRVVQQ